MSLASRPREAGNDIAFDKSHFQSRLSPQSFDCLIERPHSHSAAGEFLSASLQDAPMSVISFSAVKCS